METEFSLREAAYDDIAEMVRVIFSATEASVFSQRSFPPSDPDSHTYYEEWLNKNLGDSSSHVALIQATPRSGSQEGTQSPDSGSANLANKPTIVGWARWVRKLPPAADIERLVFTPSMYPSQSDGALAARLFQTNYDQSRKIAGPNQHWHLSMIMVDMAYQRKGIGRMLMQYGVDMIDKDGWMATVNASEEGKGLYEAFGFQVVAKTDFEHGCVAHHMKREARN